MLTRWLDGLQTFDQRAEGLRLVDGVGEALGVVGVELVNLLATELDQLRKVTRRSWRETPAGVLKLDKVGGYVTWDSDSLWPKVVAEVRLRLQEKPGQDPIEATIAAVKEAITSPTWKVTTLRRWGLDPDEFKATAPKRNVVRWAD